MLNGKDYQRALRRAQMRIEVGSLRVYWVRNGLANARLGLIVGKRAVRRAHERNRLKRTAREAFRLTCKDLPRLDIVLQVRAPVAPRTVKVVLERAFKQMSNEASQ